MQLEQLQHEHRVNGEAQARACPLPVEKRGEAAESFAASLGTGFPRVLDAGLGVEHQALCGRSAVKLKGVLS
jgi:hypothetical protein